MLSWSSFNRPWLQLEPIVMMKMPFEEVRQRLSLSLVRDPIPPVLWNFLPAAATRSTAELKVWSSPHQVFARHSTTEQRPLTKLELSLKLLQKPPILWTFSVALNVLQVHLKLHPGHFLGGSLEGENCTEKYFWAVFCNNSYTDLLGNYYLFNVLWKSTFWVGWNLNQTRKWFILKYVHKTRPRDRFYQEQNPKQANTQEELKRNCSLTPNRLAYFNAAATVEVLKKCHIEYSVGKYGSAEFFPFDYTQAEYGCWPLTHDKISWKKVAFNCLANFNVGWSSVFGKKNYDIFLESIEAKALSLPRQQQLFKLQLICPTISNKNSNYCS